MIGLGLSIPHVAGRGRAGGALSPPLGFVFLVDNDGAYLVDVDGYYLVERI